MELPTEKEDNNNHAMELVETEPEEEDEKIFDSFVCCVCLDLLYKPVVLACGHTSCFWCVHKSMSGLCGSSCPICRHPYHHFPNVCQLIHFLIVKMYPIAFRRREKQVLEEERTMGCFSPQFDGALSGLDCHCGPSSAVRSAPLSNPSSPLSLSSVSDGKLHSSGQTSSTEEDKLHKEKVDGTSLPISVRDALCSACEQLLFRPVALNCGHAYCESCITIAEDEILTCQVCQAPHPSDLPKVCLVVSDFLEKTFPKEYGSKRDTLQLKQVWSQKKLQPSSSKISAKKGIISSLFGTSELPPQLSDQDDNELHPGAGCDTCGMYPIVGSRYQCKDCEEQIGFDLCGECYNTNSKLPGRFNQRHTEDHRLELVTSPITINLLRNYSLSLGPLSLMTSLAEEIEDSTEGPPCPSDDDNDNEGSGGAAGCA